MPHFLEWYCYGFRIPFSGCDMVADNEASRIRLHNTYAINTIIL